MHLIGSALLISFFFFFFPRDFKEKENYVYIYFAEDFKKKIKIHLKWKKCLSPADASFKIK